MRPAIAIASSRSFASTLIRLLGDFDLAEEYAQDAFAAALDQWPVSGVPESPRAWIVQTARHKAIDRLRRRGSSNCTMRWKESSLRRLYPSIALSPLRWLRGRA
jgi:predicted RNA polymerase sigma factor